MTDVNPIPVEYPRVTAALAVDGASEAIAFYTSVLGMGERMRIPAPDGGVGHAELELGDSLIMVSDEYPEMGVRGPKAFGGVAVRLNVYVEDVDATFANALSAGATEVRSIEEHFWGDRSGQIEDPWGHIWNISSRVADVPPDEIARRAAQMFGG